MESKNLKTPPSSDVVPSGGVSVASALSGAATKDLGENHGNPIGQKVTPSAGRKLKLALPSSSGCRGAPAPEGSVYSPRQFDLTESEAESDMSEAESFGSEAMALSSRKRAAEFSGSTSDASGVSQSSRKTTKRRGRTTEVEDIGLALARRTLAARKRADQQADVDAMLARDEDRARETRARIGYGVSLVTDLEGKSLEDVEAFAKENAFQLSTMASKCSNIKGTVRKGLKEKAHNLMMCSAILAKRSNSGEVKALNATVRRLTDEVAALSAELAALKAEKSACFACHGPASRCAHYRGPGAGGHARMDAAVCQGGAVLRPLRPGWYGVPYPS